jgi:hypothetical protein
MKELDELMLTDCEATGPIDNQEFLAATFGMSQLHAYLSDSPVDCQE